MKVIIVGGVAGGATAAARIRRLDEHAEITVFERSGYISYANCGWESLGQCRKVYFRTGMKSDVRVTQQIVHFSIGQYIGATASHFKPTISLRRRP